MCIFIKAVVHSIQAGELRLELGNMLSVITEAISLFCISGTLVPSLSVHKPFLVMSCHGDVNYNENGV